MRTWQIMGILNVTPDSFSDGGVYVGVDAAVAQAERMLDDGADWIDVGGESTRPGAAPVTADEELRRVVPVIAAIMTRRPAAAISVDTTKAAVAAAALAAGARMVNDISAGTGDAAMLSTVARAGARYVAMHMQGTPQTMQAAPRYGDVVHDVRDYLSARLAACAAAGIARERCWIDPGIGFGKTLEQNLALLHGLQRLVELGVPILCGVSRKSLLGHLLSGAPVGERLEAGLAVSALAYQNGARIFRTHDVAATRRFLQTWETIQPVTR